MLLSFLKGIADKKDTYHSFKVRSPKHSRHSNTRRIDVRN